MQLKHVLTSKANSQSNILTDLAEFIHEKKKAATSKTDEKEEWSLLTAPQNGQEGTAKPILQWTIQEVLDKGAHTVASLCDPTTFVSITKRIRHFTAVILTLIGFLDFFQIFVLSPIHRFWLATDERKMKQVIRAYEKLTVTEASAQEWYGQTMEFSTFFRALRKYNLWACSIWAILTFAFVFQIAQDSWKYKKRHGKLYSWKTWWSQTKGKKRRVLFFLLLTVFAGYRIWYFYQLEQARNNPFRVLEIAPTYDMKTIKRAYRSLALRYFPD